MVCHSESFREENVVPSEEAITFSLVVMAVMDSGWIGETDLNSFYHLALNLSKENFRKILDKYECDFVTLRARDADDDSLTLNNAHAESYFAELKVTNQSPQRTEKWHFTDWVSFLYTKTFEWLMQKPKRVRTALFDDAVKSRRANRREINYENQVDTDRIFD